MFLSCRKSSPVKPQSPQPSLKPTRVRLTDTYTVATTCRSKLGKEADRADHELRRLVGHANMLDSLMDQLAEAERQQEGRVNALLRNEPKDQQPRKVLWIDTIAEELEESADSESDEDSDDDSDIEDNNSYEIPHRKAKSPPPKPWADYLSADDESSDEDEAHDDGLEDTELVLRRWPSNLRVPELTHEEDSGAEDGSSLSSLLQDTCLNLAAKQRSINTKKAQCCFMNATKTLTSAITVR